MKRFFMRFMFILFIAFSFMASGQGYKQCYTTEIYRERIKNHPEILVTQELLEQHTRQDQSGSSSQNRVTGQVYVIPIVFHIIHNYGRENISDAQVIDQVRILNDDYRKRSYDTASVVAAFKPIAADCEIEFRLATKDPSGNCTTGIEHIPSLLTNQADDNSKLNPWPANQYLNVWVVASLSFAGAAAYAYYPGTAPPGADGVIMLSGYVGSIGTSGPGVSRVLTHEIGHYLNLAHVWGSTNDPGVACGDDNVFDTPVTKGWTTCHLNGATCGNVIDNVQNYMEYSYCCNMFTNGQKGRMRSALTSSIGNRNNLWTNSNLVLTGTDGSAAQLCSPFTDFKADHQMICAGHTVHFTDQSWNGHPTSWNWNFPGGSPASSTDSMPAVIYNTPGTYNVTLSSGNSTGSDFMAKNSFIHVNGISGLPVPYAESFESAGSFPGSDGYVNNPDGGNTWQRSTNAGSTGTASIMINNFSGNTAREIDEYITPPIDLTGFLSPKLTFKVAYAQRNTSSADALNVYVSTNCGESWTWRYGKSGYTLATAGISPGPFTPNTTQWREDRVSILPFQNQSAVRFKFQNTSDEGNNIFIDDINIINTLTGIDEQMANASSLHVFPNPAIDKFLVTFTTSRSQKIDLKVTDALGNVVETLVHSSLPAGDFQYTTDKNLAAGIYFICLTTDEESINKKLVITK